MTNNFRYAISLAQMLYDIDINDMDTLIEIGLVAYGFIGNKNTELKVEIVNVNKNGLVKLPCKADNNYNHPIDHPLSYTVHPCN